MLQREESSTLQLVSHSKALEWLYVISTPVNVIFRQMFFIPKGGGGTSEPSCQRPLDSGGVVSLHQRLRGKGSEVRNEALFKTNRTSM